MGIGEFPSIFENSPILFSRRVDFFIWINKEVEISKFKYNAGFSLPIKKWLLHHQKIDKILSILEYL